MYKDIKLKIKDGKVAYLMNAGSDIVRSVMNKESAERIINCGVKKISKKHKGYNLCVNDEIYFETLTCNENKK